MTPVQPKNPASLVRGIKLQKRWRFCQDFARDLYRSDLSDDALKSVAGSIATAMRAREDEMQQREGLVDEPEIYV